MASLGSLFSIFNKADKSVIGVDIGSSAIKIVQLRKKKGRALLETYGELSLGPYANIEVGRATNLGSDVIAKAILDLVREAKVTSRIAGVSIPFSASLVSFVKLPALSDRELAEMVPIEARKYIPVPISEVRLDWSRIPSAEEETKAAPGADKQVAMADVLIVAIHNETLAKYQDIANRAALAMPFYELEIFSSIRSVFDPHIKTQMILDMGAGSTKLYIVEQGILKSSHTINRGSQDITLAISQSQSISIPEAENIKRTIGLSHDPEKKQIADTIALSLDYIFYEANRVILNYQKKYAKDIGKVILTGGGVLLPGFIELAENSFKTEVELGNPFDRVEAPAVLIDILKTAGPEFAVALGLAFRKLAEID